MKKKHLKTLIEFNKRFTNGEQYLKLYHPSNNWEIREIEKDFYWKERLVFNHIFPIVEMFKLKKPTLTDEELYGENSLVANLIPLQVCFNNLKNKKYEMINKMACGILSAEDGSIDTDTLEENGLQPGKVLIYRQGAQKPDFTNTNFNFEVIEREEENVLNEMFNIVNVFKEKFNIKEEFNIPGFLGE